MTAPLLEVRDLQTHFHTRAGVVKAVDGVSFTLERGQILGLVGESGSGKTVTGFSLLGLVDQPGRIVGGSIRLDGVELVGMPAEPLRRLRGRRLWRSHLGQLPAHPRAGGPLGIAVEPARDHLRDARAAHRDAEQQVGDLHRGLLMGDEDELALPGQAAQHAEEPAQVGIVEGRLDLVEEVERRGARHGDGQAEGKRDQRLLPAGEQRK